MPLPLPNPDDPSNPGLPAPLFADVDAVRGDQLRALCQLIWGNFDEIETEFDASAKAAALAAALTGYVAGSNAAIAATDTILQAFAKTQGQINAVNARFFTQPAVQASTSGTSIDFNSIPAGVKKIMVLFSDVSLSGTSLMLVRVGSGSVLTTGYKSAVTTNGADTSDTSGFLPCYRGDASNRVSGIMTLALQDASTNTWVVTVATSGAAAGGGSGAASAGGGFVSLPGTLDRLRVTAANGSDTFDGGKIAVMLE